MTYLDLKNKTVLITGAAQGLGLSMAQAFAASSSNVWILDINESALKKARQTHDNPKVQFYTCDITNPEEVHKAHKKIGAIDVLINNAGILRDASLFKMTPEQFDDVLSVHAKGTFLMTQAFASDMKAQSSGAIVNLSSVASQGNFGQTNYACAKAGIIGMTKTWALELSKYNVRVNAIAPGLIETDMTRSIPEPVQQAMVEKIPFKRMGKPNEVADLALFLASTASSYIQGQVIHINGGYYL